MQTNILTYPAQLIDWWQVRQFLQLRKSVFIDDLGWSLHATDDVEFEQYDALGQATYVLVLEENRVIGGARLLRTSTKIGRGTVTYSYMIRDAYLELIDLPSGMCREAPPDDPDIWELTRFVASRADPDIASAILTASLDFLAAMGAKSCLFLGPPAMKRLYRRFGMTIRPLGPLQKDDTGSFGAYEVTIAGPHDANTKTVF